MKRIRTNEEYLKALSRFEEIFNAKEDSKEGEEAFLLGLLIESYENENFPISEPDPIGYIDARLDALGLKRKDLEGVIAKGTAHVSEVMNRKRALSLEAIRALEEKFNMDPKILIQRYTLRTTSTSRKRKSVAKPSNLVAEPLVPYSSPRDAQKAVSDHRSKPQPKPTRENLKATKSSKKSDNRTKSSRSKEH